MDGKIFTSLNYNQNKNYSVTTKETNFHFVHSTILRMELYGKTQHNKIIIIVIIMCMVKAKVSKEFMEFSIN